MNGRAIRRLGIAAGLAPDLTGDAAGVLEKINAMPALERQKLKELVDWVEDYERHEYFEG